MAKYTGPYIVVSLPPSSHNLTIEVRNVHNPLNVKNISVKKVKRAFLKPNQVGLIPLEVQTNKETVIDNKENKSIENPTTTVPYVVKERVVENPQGRTTQSQKKRAKKDKPVTDNREEWEIEEILKEGVDRKTGELTYFIKLKSYNKKHYT